jgi:hypothetical protein|tara:strand:- start:3178 stop:3450 length:273 start_codon:yes stop_codon:yes gene_type:complete
MDTFNYKEYIAEGKLLKENQSSEFSIGDDIIYKFGGGEYEGKITDHFGDGVFVELEKMILDPDTNVQIDTFELYDGEHNSWGSIEDLTHR